MIKIGLKANANFLFGQMKGDTLGGSTGEPYWKSIMHVNQQQFEKFQRLIIAFGGDHSKSLSKLNGLYAGQADYECYFTKSV
ncbi:hypothetical protein LCGC14_0619430 [marine sediment metagenome]|uniref:Uncharacterized protein n=1 Tax=marine sediment metagenome TaxID=412755 RepID=A0A0F9TRQ0_9ZZZZ